MVITIHTQHLTYGKTVSHMAVKMSSYVKSSINFIYKETQS